MKAVFAQESREAALAKAETVAAKMETRRLKAAANCLREGIGETTTYLLSEFPVNHRTKLRTNNMIERIFDSLGSGVIAFGGHYEFWWLLRFEAGVIAFGSRGWLGSFHHARDVW